MSTYRGPQCRKSSEEMLSFDAEYFEYLDNRSKYKYIKARQESES